MRVSLSSIPSMVLVFDDDDSIVDVNHNIFTKNHFPMMVADDLVPFKSLKDSNVSVGSVQLQIYFGTPMQVYRLQAS